MQPQVQFEAPATPPRNPLKALYQVFYSPSDAYTSLKGKLPWIVPLVAGVIVAVLMNVMIINVMGMGTMVRNQLESNPTIAERLGPQGIDEAVRSAEQSGARKIMAYGGAAVGLPIVLCIVAGIMLGALMITGANTNFSAVFAANALSTYASLVVTAACSALFLAAVHDYSGVNPQQLVMLNVGAFLPETTPKFLRGLAGGIDLIGFWAVFLQTIGLVRLSERVTMKQALTVSIALYILWVLVRAGFSSLF